MRWPTAKAEPPTAKNSAIALSTSAGDGRCRRSRTFTFLLRSTDRPTIMRHARARIDPRSGGFLPRTRDGRVRPKPDVLLPKARLAGSAAALEAGRAARAVPARGSRAR